MPRPEQLSISQSSSSSIPTFRSNFSPDYETTDYAHPRSIIGRTSLGVGAGSPSKVDPFQSRPTYPLPSPSPKSKLRHLPQRTSLSTHDHKPAPRQTSTLTSPSKSSIHIPSSPRSRIDLHDHQSTLSLSASVSASRRASTISGGTAGPARLSRTRTLLDPKATPTPKIVLASPSTSTIHYLFPSIDSDTSSNLSAAFVSSRLPRYTGRDSVSGESDTASTGGSTTGPKTRSRRRHSKVSVGTTEPSVDLRDRPSRRASRSGARSSRSLSGLFALDSTGSKPRVYDYEPVVEDNCESSASSQIDTLGSDQIPALGQPVHFGDSLVIPSSQTESAIHRLAKPKPIGNRAVKDLGRGHPAGTRVTPTTVTILGPSRRVPSLGRDTSRQALGGNTLDTIRSSMTKEDSASRGMTESVSYVQGVMRKAQSMRTLRRQPTLGDLAKTRKGVEEVHSTKFRLPALTERPNKAGLGQAPVWVSKSSSRATAPPGEPSQHDHSDGCSSPVLPAPDFGDPLLLTEVMPTSPSYSHLDYSTAGSTAPSRRGSLTPSNFKRSNVDTIYPVASSSRKSSVIDAFMADSQLVRLGGDDNGRGIGPVSLAMSRGSTRSGMGSYDAGKKAAEADMKMRMERERNRTLEKLTQNTASPARPQPRTGSYSGPSSPLGDSQGIRPRRFSLRRSRSQSLKRTFTSTSTSTATTGIMAGAKGRARSQSLSAKSVRQMGISSPVPLPQISKSDTGGDDEDKARPLSEISRGIFLGDLNVDLGGRFPLEADPSPSKRHERSSLFRQSLPAVPRGYASPFGGTSIHSHSRRSSKDESSLYPETTPSSGYSSLPQSSDPSDFASPPLTDPSIPAVGIQDFSFSRTGLKIRPGPISTNAAGKDVKRESIRSEKYRGRPLHPAFASSTSLLAPSSVGLGFSPIGAGTPVSLPESLLDEVVDLTGNGWAYDEYVAKRETNQRNTSDDDRVSSLGLEFDVTLGASRPSAEHCSRTGRVASSTRQEPEGRLEAVAMTRSHSSIGGTASTKAKSRRSPISANQFFIPNPHLNSVVGLRMSKSLGSGLLQEAFRKGSATAPSTGPPPRPARSPSRGRPGQPNNRTGASSTRDPEGSATVVPEKVDDSPQEGVGGPSTPTPTPRAQRKAAKSSKMTSNLSSFSLCSPPGAIEPLPLPLPIDDSYVDVSQTNEEITFESRATDTLPDQENSSARRRNLRNNKSTSFLSASSSLRGLFKRLGESPCSSSNNSPNTPSLSLTSPRGSTTTTRRGSRARGTISSLALSRISGLQNSTTSTAGKTSLKSGDADSKGEQVKYKGKLISSPNALDDSVASVVFEKAQSPEAEEDEKEEQRRKREKVLGLAVSESLSMRSRNGPIGQCGTLNGAGTGTGHGTGVSQLGQRDTKSRSKIPVRLMASAEPGQEPPRHPSNRVVSADRSFESVQPRAGVGRGIRDIGKEETLDSLSVYSVKDSPEGHTGSGKTRRASQTVLPRTRIPRHGSRDPTPTKIPTAPRNPNKTQSSFKDGNVHDEEADADYLQVDISHWSPSPIKKKPKSKASISHLRGLNQPFLGPLRHAKSTMSLHKAKDSISRLNASTNSKQGQESEHGGTKDVFDEPGSIPPTVGNVSPRRIVSMEESRRFMDKTLESHQLDPPSQIPAERSPPESAGPTALQLSDSMSGHSQAGPSKPRSRSPRWWTKSPILTFSLPHGASKAKRYQEEKPNGGKRGSVRTVAAYDPKLALPVSSDDLPVRSVLEELMRREREEDEDEHEDDYDGCEGQHGDDEGLDHDNGDRVHCDMEMENEENLDREQHELEDHDSGSQRHARIRFQSISRTAMTTTSKSHQSTSRSQTPTQGNTPTNTTTGTSTGTRNRTRSGLRSRVGPRPTDDRSQKAQKAQKVLEWCSAVDETKDIREMEDKWRLHVEEEKERMRGIAGRLSPTPGP